MRRGKALSAFDAGGRSRVLGRLPEMPREVALLPNGHAVIAVGRNLSWMDLTNGRTATFVLTKVDDRLAGRVEDVTIAPD